MSFLKMKYETAVKTEASSLAPHEKTASILKQTKSSLIKLRKNNFTHEILDEKEQVNIANTIYYIFDVLEMS